MSKPVVAIVGRPNVGKSSLFNVLAGEQIAIVKDTPGVTRDRIYADCSWLDRNFTLIDTGGIEPDSHDMMLTYMREQAEIAIETADVIIMVTDVKVGVTAADMEVANLLKRSKKPVVLAVNKCDAVGPVNPDVYEFYDLGLGDPIETSAIHGHGAGDMLDECLKYFPPEDGARESENRISVAIIGKPNVGKSSLVNKMDNPSRVDPALYEFYSLGLGDPIPLSAVHGHGTGDLLDACLQYFPPAGAEEAEEDRIHVAIIGKPNVGKSSLLNLIAGEQRVIVSDVAGTTRDAVDLRIDNEFGSFTFIDTAGIRRKGKVTDRVERFSVMRAQLAVERSDVCLIMMDAREGVTEQDTKIAGLAHEAGKASVIIMNKWDLVEKETSTMEKARKKTMQDLAFMSYAPVLFISALTGQRVNRIFELVNYVYGQSSMRITTGMLNNVLADAQARVQPPSDRGRRLKIYYMTQTGVKPPNFVVFCNSRELFHFSYLRYLENQIRATFGLEGTPVRMVVRQKGDREE